jgi:hypothetical protein
MKLKINHTMKTIIKSTAITTIFTLLFSFNIMAEINFNEESYIDDIPFNTEAIYSEVVIERNIIDYELNEEAYINDIPFSTETIAENKLYELAIKEEFTFDEETYIDDIPFNTEEICQQLNATTESDTLTCHVNESLNGHLQEESVELKYFEQHSHILVRF